MKNESMRNILNSFIGLPIYCFNYTFCLLVPYVY